MKQLNFNEWMKWREQGIGGSAGPVITRTSPFESPLELFLRRTKRIPPQKQNYRMWRGRHLEPVARTLYEQQTGIPMPPRLLVNSGWPVFRASYDGLNRDEQLPLEIKCPGKEDHKSALNGQIPKKYLFQCVHLLLVGGFKRIDYFSYNPDFDGPQTALVTLKRDNRLEQTLIDEEKRWWNWLQKDIPPPAGEKELPWPWPKYVSEEGEKMKVVVDRKKVHSKEISELLERAKALGASSLRLEFSLTGNGDGHENEAEAEASGELIPPPRSARPLCGACGEEEVPSKSGRGFYCVACYIANKNSR